MHEVSRVLTDPSGLHARLVARIVNEAAKWESAMRVRVGGRAADAHDLMGLMGLDAVCGEEVHVEIEGPDEWKATVALGRILKDM